MEARATFQSYRREEWFTRLPTFICSLSRMARRARNWSDGLMTQQEKLSRRQGNILNYALDNYPGLLSAILTKGAGANGTQTHMMTELAEISITSRFAS